MKRKVPASLYAPATPREIEAQLRRGKMPSAFTRRMRVLNIISATTLMKMEGDLLRPFDVMDLHHILDKQISQDAILDQMDSEALSYACRTGNISSLWDIAPSNPLLERGLLTGWMRQFMNDPFDPICIMLAMRARLMLDLIDELGHSYNLIRAIGYGFIDFEEIPGEEPGDPGDYYPPGIDNPIDTPEDGITPPPGPGDPGYVPPGELKPGDPGYTTTPRSPGYVEPSPLPGEPGGGPDFVGDSPLYVGPEKLCRVVYSYQKPGTPVDYWFHEPWHDFETNGWTPYKYGTASVTIFSESILRQEVEDGSSYTMPYRDEERDYPTDFDVYWNVMTIAENANRSLAFNFSGFRFYLTLSGLQDLKFTRAGQTVGGYNAVVPHNEWSDFFAEIRGDKVSLYQNSTPIFTNLSLWVYSSNPGRMTEYAERISLNYSDWLYIINRD